MNSGVTWWYPYGYNNSRRYVTDVRAVFAERTAAGWTSMLMPPRIDEELDLYNQNGKKYDFETGESELNTNWQNALSGIGQSSLREGSNFSCINYYCMTFQLTNGRTMTGCMCTNWSYTGGSVPEPTGLPPTGTPSQPKYMHYVKRVRVAMADRSTHEFRKSDAVYGFCVGTNNPNNGLNCERTDGEDVYGTFLSVDGSGMKLVRDENGSTLYLPNGGKYIFPANPAAIKGLYATAFIDNDGNRLAFSHTEDTENNQSTNRWTDTLGREITDPVPQNWETQSQNPGTQEIYLPGLNGQARNYVMRWSLLKPLGCEDSTNPDCGSVEGTIDGALENQSQKLYYEAKNYCHGNLSDDLEQQSGGEILFTAPATALLGLRMCNSFTVQMNPDGTPIPDTNGNSIPYAPRFNPVVLSEVQLPNGRSYQFKYNRYGEITTIIYPTGSREEFVYAQISPLAGYQNMVFDQTNRGVVERRIYNSDNRLEQRWNYSAQISDPTNATSPYIVTIKAPNKDNPSDENRRLKTVRYLTRVPQYPPGAQSGNFGFDDPRGGMPYEERTYDENGNLRTRTLTEYIVAAARAGGDARATRDARPKRNVSIIIEGSSALATLSTTEYDDGGSIDDEYFSDLNVRETKSYPFVVIPKTTAESDTLSWTAIDNYFAGVTPTSISRTDYIYGAPGESYKARGIIGLSSESRVLNPSNTADVLAKTQIVFDESSYLVADGETLTGNLAGTWTNPSSNYRAKPTTVKTWQKETNSWIQTHTQYDQYGNVRKVWDASGDANRFVETEYASLYGCAYPTKVIQPPPDPTGTYGTNLTSAVETAYDFTTGLPLRVKDDFGQEIETEYHDPLLRPTKIFGVGSFVIPVTETIYDDTPATAPDHTGDGDPISVKIRRQIDQTNWDEAETFFDSLGRTVKTQAEDSGGDVTVETQYDFLGRVRMTTNPYRQGEANIYWNLIEYDELGRVRQSREPIVNQNPSEPSGSVLGVTSYSISNVPNYVGRVVTSTDASGRKSRSITNALGQVTRIDEATGTGGTIDEDLGTLANPLQPTFYTYSPQGQMVKVQQGKTGDATIQNRYFLYDSLGRLIRVRQPEQQINQSLSFADSVTGNSDWTAAFTYDVSGNLLTTVDAKGTVITNAYDKAGRVETRTYSGEPGGQTTPNVSFYYDGKGLSQPQTPNYAKGKLTKVTSTVSETVYAQFDNLGRLLESRQITDGKTYTSKYQYNFSGALAQQTYPSGRVVKNDFESDGNLSRIYGQANPNAAERTYANSFSYTADGKIQRLKLGSGRWESAKFNPRLQVTELSLGTSDGNGSLWKLNYEYGELNADGSISQTKNTGNIAKQTVSFSGLANPFVQTFRYDSIYRLTEAREVTGTGANPATNWLQTFGYDRFGNRTSFSQTGNGIAALQPAVDAATNRFSAGQGYTYDFNGNLIQDAEGRQFTFNGENKQIKVVQAGQIKGEYFYDGEGKRVKKISNLETTIFVYDGIGKLVAEYSTAAPSPNPTTNYTATDQLGSPRVITDANGKVISRRDFMPFGEELYADNQTRTTANKYSTSNQDAVRQRFTGYQKDTETQLDFAEARYYNNQHGRFTAVDPLLASGKSANPQTFNRYVYVTNNPLILTDPSGLCGGTIHGIKERQCPADYQGTVYTNGNRYSDVQYDKTWTKFTGEATITRDDNGVRTYINGSGWKQVNLSILFLTNGFPANPYEQAIDGTGQGVSNASINISNIATSIAWNNYTGVITPSPLKIERYQCNSRITCSWSGGTENAANFAPIVFGEVFGSASSLSITSRNPFSTSRAFYSGANMEARAIEEDFQTLGQTRAGQNLQRLIESKNIPWERAEGMWRRLSVPWARGVPDGSTVNVFLNNPRAGSIWLRVEKPILLEKGANLIIRK
ncbi:MAG TPA: RHS repeat-associated core domain-containing protein [Pyrinomonadaceae bacterium]|jgi:RHS repeat-associated protein